MFSLKKFIKARRMEKKLNDVLYKINENCKTEDEVLLSAHLEGVEDMYTELYYNALMSRLYSRIELENILLSFKACRRDLNNFRLRNGFTM